MKRSPTFLLLIGMLLSLLPLAQLTAATNNLVATPQTLEATLTQGQRASAGFTLENRSSAAVRIRITQRLSQSAGNTSFQKLQKLPVSSLAFPDTKVDPRLIETLERPQTASAIEGVDAFLYLPTQADLMPAFSIPDWNERGEFVLHALQEVATKQTEVLPELEALKATGHISGYQRFFAVNAILIEGVDMQAIESMVELSQVQYLEKVDPTALIAPVANEPTSQETIIPWGLEMVGAPGIWSDLGVRGNGVIVANIDTGVEVTHPALQSSYLGNTVGNEYAWFDLHFTPEEPSCPTNTPCDFSGHGTHTMGTMLGKAVTATQIITVGMAPAARWIAVRGCNVHCYTKDIMKGGEWLLAPYKGGPDNPHDYRPDLRPNIVNNSWGGGGGNLYYQGLINSWYAAGILPVFSAGNYGPNPGSVISPSDNDNTMSVGSVDQNGEVSYFSGRGPGYGPNPQKPDLIAPGNGILSSYKGDYSKLSGASMSTPHVSGCGALGISAGLSSVEIADLMRQTAADDPSGNGYDYDNGYGTLNCLKAVLYGLGWTVVPNQGQLFTLAPGQERQLPVIIFGDHAPVGTHTVAITIEAINAEGDIIETENVILTFTVKPRPDMRKAYLPIVTH